MKLKEVIKILHDHKEGEIPSEAIDSAVRRLRRYEMLLEFVKTPDIAEAFEHWLLENSQFGAGE